MSLPVPQSLAWAHPLVAGVVCPEIRHAHRTAGAGLAAHPGGAHHADLGADRIGQDARRVSGLHRPAGAQGARGRTGRPHRGGLHLAAQGARQRHPEESGRPARRNHCNWRGNAGCSCPRSAAPCAPATRLPHERRAMLKRPPHILVTTPESLYILLTAEKSRGILHDVETVIVDEIHAVADDKRGVHLALSLERLEALTHKPPARIGLSATQKPIETVAAFPDGQRPARSRDREHRPQAATRSRRRGPAQPSWAPSPPTKCGTRFTTASSSSWSSIARRWSS